jgi:hypothetical protein
LGDTFTQQRSQSPVRLFYTIIKAGPAGGLRPPSGPAVTDGHRETDLTLDSRFGQLAVVQVCVARITLATSSHATARTTGTTNGGVDPPKNPSAATTNPATTSHFGKTPVFQAT